MVTPNLNITTSTAIGAGIAPVLLSGRAVGPGLPAYIVAEVGINHNGDVNIAKRLIDAAVLAGCDAVKFQKRTPELCVPLAMRNIVRETPWGLMTYMEYRERMEFGEREFLEIDRYCAERGVAWFASCFDSPSVSFISKFTTPAIKIPSCALTDDSLLIAARATGNAIVLSTGMSTSAQIDHAVGLLRDRAGGLPNVIVLHCTSTYPCPAEELNLRMIGTLGQQYPCPIGYSGHEVGLQSTLAAATLGACFIERHITLDRAMWGSDQAASLEPGGFSRLVRDVRIIEKALGDGVKRVYESEMAVMKRLRPAEQASVLAKAS
jgi:N-acetylneuraminate synthase